ncbi:hypothetical protein D9619_013211 [Psilocybe cf. subviscida]|uniref:Uncharacterized protein n=1 Tax=Psilocybe cf. subviscida TaxID=2480587 RepID=A0A8H5B6S8_9AGAR|nr:hypothetical protein D9619_013211 [Psilocybe cf. subviscida]
MLASNAHLLMQFRESASDETYELAKSFLQKTRTTMQSIVGPMSAGCPAVCILLASQRLNNNDFSEKDTQKQSSLNPKDFKKLYSAIKNALEEEEQSAVITYNALYDKYPTLKIWKKEFHPFIVDIEKALVETGEEPNTSVFRCSSFFFLWNAISPNVIPETMQYAADNHIVAKLMSNAILKLRTSHSDVEKTIKAHSKKVQERERAKLDQAPGASIPVPSPTTTTRKAREGQAPQKQTMASSSTLVPTSTVPTPTRTQSSRHATLVAQLPAPAGAIWKSRPKRELPSRDSPKKRVPEEAPMDVDEEPGTQSKKRRTTAETTPQAVESPSRVLRTPVRKNTQIFPPSALRSVSPKKPAKVPVVDPLQLLATFEDEPDESQEKRRFRPVYLEHRLWLARDPRLTAKTR